MNPMPWEAYWDALETVEVAKRWGTPQMVELAVAEAEEARERCAWLGGFLFMVAAKDGSMVVQKFLAKHFGGLAASAWDKATTAIHRVADLETRVRFLERELADRNRREHEEALRRTEPEPPQLLEFPSRAV